jgi:hypothetical protein
MYFSIVKLLSLSYKYQNTYESNETRRIRTRIRHRIRNKLFGIQNTGTEAPVPGAALSGTDRIQLNLLLGKHFRFKQFVLFQRSFYSRFINFLLPYLSVRVKSVPYRPTCLYGWNLYRTALHVCTGVQVHKAEEQRKLEQDARTLYIRFIKTFPTSHDEIKVRS